ncbi:MAG TPA: TldD/PmbA family protein [Actinomycetota bacterium]|nr:TldD/PmbA family protein [Actinomycetota bacterium]
MSADGLLDAVRSIAGRAEGGEALEAWASHEREFEVKVHGGEVESISVSEPRGIGVRIIDDGRMGFSFTTDLTEGGVDAVLAAARSNARWTTPDECARIGTISAAGTDPSLLLLTSPAFGDATPADKVSLALELERAARALDPRVRTVEDAVYADTDTSLAIATSAGAEGSFRRTDAWCYVVAIATEGDDTEVAFDFDLARALDGLDPADVAARAVAKAVGVLGAHKIPSARMPVIFDPYTAAQFLGVLGNAITAEAVQKGRSLFAGKEGEAVAAASLSLIDDGRVPGAPGSAPWDAEGVPTTRTVVIEAGRLNSFLYDSTTACRAGRDSTGNAARAGFKSAPKPSATNLTIESTGHSRADVLAAAGARAFLVQDFHGVHSGANPISGDFSVGATGRLVSGGEVGEAVKEVTIAAPMLEILCGIEAVADDLRWLPFGGSYGGATTLIAEMTVAGS